MRRPFVISTGALALALMPAALFAQTPPAQQTPTQQTPPSQGQQPAPQGQQPTPEGQQPAQQGQQPAAAAPEQPSAPKLTFKGNTGMLLVTVKGDQTAAFEEMVAKLRSGAAASTDPALKAGGTVRVFKSADPAAGGNAFYVMLYDPAQPGTEYSWLDIINKTLTPEQQRDPATREMYTRFAGAIVSTNILNLSEVK